MRAARASFALHAEAALSGEPPGELRERLAQQRLEARAAGPTRRELIAGAGLLAGAAMVTQAPATALGRAPGRGGPPRVAIVGAGLAGLRCAHRLWTESRGVPIAPTVYEANPERSGGRCWTLRGFFAGDLQSEHGGSFLNSDQTAVRGLAAKLGLTEEIVDGGDLEGGEEVYLIDGRRYSYPEAQADWADFGYPAFRRAAGQLHSAGGEARLDAMSVPDWLESSGIGASSRFGKLMLANAVTENGGDPADMSALDLIELLTRNPRSSLSPLPGDDERYHLVGGNDRLIGGMLAALPPETVRHDHVLESVRASGSRTIELTFRVAGSSVDVTADYVVLALPFSTLREVDLSRSGLSAQKLRVIRTMGMGTNAKIHLEVAHKPWPALGLSGATYGEFQRLACAWDDSVALGAGGEPALYVAFPGGQRGATGITGAAHGIAPAADVEWALGELEPLIPGMTAAFTGRAYEDHWALDPWVRGAYSYDRVGQASAYGRIAGATEGRILFAGEHTSIANQGFLDGAVETGERAASRLLARVT